jgi:hypothetical protein
MTQRQLRGDWGENTAMALGSGDGTDGGHHASLNYQAIPFPTVEVVLQHAIWDASTSTFTFAQVS